MKSALYRVAEALQAFIEPDKLKFKIHEQTPSDVFPIQGKCEYCNFSVSIRNLEDIKNHREWCTKDQLRRVLDVLKDELAKDPDSKNPIPECPDAPYPTNQLRYHCTRSLGHSDRTNHILQQLWVVPGGDNEWRNVPAANF